MGIERNAFLHQRNNRTLNEWFCCAILVSYNTTISFLFFKQISRKIPWNILKKNNKNKTWALCVVLVALCNKKKRYRSGRKWFCDYEKGYERWLKQSFIAFMWAMQQIIQGQTQEQETFLQVSWIHQQKLVSVYCDSFTPPPPTRAPQHAPAGWVPRPLSWILTSECNLPGGRFQRLVPAPARTGLHPTPCPLRSQAPLQTQTKTSQTLVVSKTPAVKSKKKFLPVTVSPSQMHRVAIRRLVAALRKQITTKLQLLKKYWKNR